MKELQNFILFFLLAAYWGNLQGSAKPVKRKRNVVPAQEINPMRNRRGITVVVLNQRNQTLLRLMNTDIHHDFNELKNQIEYKLKMPIAKVGVFRREDGRVIFPSLEYKLGIYSGKTDFSEPPHKRSELVVIVHFFLPKPAQQGAKIVIRQQPSRAQLPLAYAVPANPAAQVSLPVGRVLHVGPVPLPHAYAVPIPPVPVVLPHPSVLPVAPASSVLHTISRRVVPNKIVVVQGFDRKAYYKQRNK